MYQLNDAVQAHPRGSGRGVRFFDNGCAVFAAPERGMSHNGRTPQGVGVWPASVARTPRERQLRRQTVGASVEGPRINGD